MSGDDEALDRRAAKLSALLRATDAPVPPIAFPAGRIAAARQRRTVQRWRMAAAIAVLLTGAALVRPVRAWIVEAARTLFAGPAAAPAAAPTAEIAAEPAEVVPTNVVTFEPGAGVFVLEVATRQATGTLRVVRAEGPNASAAIIGDPADAELFVRHDGLRIDNRRLARADYVVRLPASVRRLVVRIADEPARGLSPGAELPLATLGEPLE